MKHDPTFIPFNRPAVLDNELKYIAQAVELGHIAADGVFAEKCRSFFKERYIAGEAILTNSCTSALEMTALLLKIGPGDEVILPSYTYLSTANAFALRGARLVFADSCADHPNMDIASVRKLISPATKAIVCMHYGGISCDMDALMQVAHEHQIPVVEDAAHAIEAKYRNQHQLGTIGDFGVLSFHETKNITSGEGGLLMINNKKYIDEAWMIANKGSNRKAFQEGKTSSYEWTSLGSSFLASELSAAYLFGQLEHLEKVQLRRMQIWNEYYRALQPLAGPQTFELPVVPEYAASNGHLFYIMLPDMSGRDALIHYLRSSGIYAVFHYQALHRSPFGEKYAGAQKLPFAEKYSDCLIRLPLFYDLTQEQTSFITRKIIDFFSK